MLEVRVDIDKGSDETAQIEFISSEKGRRKMILGGYMYVRDKSKNGTTYWRCENMQRCKSRVSTAEGDIILRPPSEHSHPPSHERVAVAKSKARMRERAVNSNECAANIIRSETHDITSLEASGVLPKRKSLERMIQRKRLCPEGEGLVEELRLTTRGEGFVIEEDSESGFYMFATQPNLDILKSCAHWVCEGGFRTNPPGKYQVYTILALIDGTRLVPLVYALHDFKTDVCSSTSLRYDLMFRVLDKQRPGITPETLTIDYELGAYDYLVTNFQQADIFGSFFHFGQCNLNKFESLSLQRWCVENPEHALRIKCLQALAFVPPDDVIRRFDDLVASFSEDDQDNLHEYIDYFEEKWIGPVREGVRYEPIFPIRCWNVFNRIHHQLQQINSNIEKWHNAFKKRIAIHNPSVRRLVKKIIHEQDSHERFIECIIPGVPGPPQKRRFDATYERLKQIVNEYDSEKTETNFYLREIANSL